MPTKVLRFKAGPPRPPRRKRTRSQAQFNRIVRKRLNAMKPEIKLHQQEFTMDSFTAFVPQTIKPLNGVNSGSTQGDRDSISIRALSFHIRALLNIPVNSSGFVVWRCVIWQRVSQEFLDSDDNTNDAGEYFDIDASGRMLHAGAAGGNVLASKATDVRRYTTKTLLDRYGVSNATAVDNTGESPRNIARGRVILDRTIRFPFKYVAYSGNALTHPVTVCFAMVDASGTIGSEAVDFTTELKYTDV